MATLLFERLLTPIARLAGLDAHVFATLLFRGWALVAGVVTMLLVPICLPREHQGFYFTFSSLISIQIFFELGFNHVITQLVSHEFALMRKATDEAERQRHASRLASVRTLSQRWYRIMAVLFAIVSFTAGFTFFGRQQALPATEWWMPWALLCVCSALNLYASPQLAISEGLGRVDLVARLRLVQSMVGYTAMWALLLLHARLWAAVLVPAVAAALSLWWIAQRTAPHQFAQRSDTASASGAGNGAPSAAITWRRDIFPLQWRIALSWVSGYFIFQIFNPFIFSFHGAVTAGRTGLALAAYTAILGLGMSWVNATSPGMSAAIARGDRSELRATFRRVATRSVLFTAFATLVLMAGRTVAAWAGWALADRIADVPTLVFMGCATVGNCLIGAMAIFMRCHKEEPMLVSSVVMAVLMLAAVATTSRFAVHWVFALYAALTMLVGLPWTVMIFRRYWTR